MERLRDCMQELVKFTLETYINEAAEFDIGISKEFCSNLLQDEDDPLDQYPRSSADTLGGVPAYPLYRCLALALLQSIISEGFCRPCKRMVLIKEDIFLQQGEERWNKLILEKGFELVNILKDVVVECHVQEPYFFLLKDGLKTIEGRCAGGVYNRIAPGTSILVNKCVAFAVEDVHQYASFSEMLEAEGLAKVLPGVETVEEGVQVYRKFYTEEKERSNGVIAICVSKLAAQPYIILASLLAGLSYAGIQSLLGVAHTAGTVFDALPPPRSTLLSSFTLPYKANVKGASLTHGAREFTKHAHRSSDKFWGIVSGNDLDKNKHAVAVIYYLIANCCWLNVHVVQPHGAVFEIRVADGYGARWSNNGTKFIGFVEPYVEDGHSRGWRH